MHHASLALPPITRERKHAMDPADRHTATACPAPQWRPNPPGYVRSDERVFADLCEALMRERDIDTGQLRVSVRDGVATLQGRAASRRDHARVAQLAAAVRGVRGVDDQLCVEGEAPERALDPALAHGLFGELVHEHRGIAAMFDDVIDRRRDAPADRDALFATLADALRLHALVEAELLYPALEPHAPGDVRRAREEHRLVAQLVGALRGDAVGDDVWQARLEVLRAVVDLHARGEEHGLFPQCLRVLSSERAAALLDRYRSLRTRHSARADAPPIAVVPRRERAYHPAPCTPIDARDGT